MATLEMQDGQTTSVLSAIQQTLSLLGVKLQYWPTNPASKALLDQPSLSDEENV